MWEDWVGKPADVASLLSLAVSVYAAWQITVVRRRIAFDVRVDEKISEIEAFVGWFDANVSVFPENQRDATFRVNHCVAWLGRIQNFMPKDVKERIRGIGKIQKRYLLASRDEERLERLWELRSEVSIILALVKDSVADRRVGGIDDA